MAEKFFATILVIFFVNTKERPTYDEKNGDDNDSASQSKN